jgi:hypothetical protein
MLGNAGTGVTLLGSAIAHGAGPVETLRAIESEGVGSLGSSVVASTSDHKSKRLVCNTFIRREIQNGPNL